MIRWTYAFIDRPTAVTDRAKTFWTAVTGTYLSRPWGDRGEFITLIADKADACLLAQAGMSHRYPRTPRHRQTTYCGKPCCPPDAPSP